MLENKTGVASVKRVGCRLPQPPAIGNFVE